MTGDFTPQELVALRELARRNPNTDAAVARIAYLESVIGLERGTVHVISDIHGDAKKLEHVIRNASGSLRPLVQATFGDRLHRDELNRFLALIYYPSQMIEFLNLRHAGPAERDGFVRNTLARQFELIAAMTSNHLFNHIEAAFPRAYRSVFKELLWDAIAKNPPHTTDRILKTLATRGKGLQAVRWASRAIQQLSVFELIAAGDLGDRGPRLDRVVDILRRQSSLRIVWGNHDVTWMGASLGHEPLIATVLRVSLRYGRLSQIEEGFGITLQPLEKLARDVYGDDPASQFVVRGRTLREQSQMARMQKAIAVIQFKLETELVRRRPEFQMADRAVVDHVDPLRGTVVLDGVEHELIDKNLPTVDPQNPTRLSPEEARCMERIRRSFVDSTILREQMRFVAQKGSTYLIRDKHLIVHGCLPVDEMGDFLPLRVDGKKVAGRAMLEALNTVVHRAFRDRRLEDLDMLWYLWAGPRSPMFGKDKMATFERAFVADKDTHTERRNPYFQLIHERDFCTRLLEEFGIDPDGGMIVNGHVPVKVEKGEQPMKRSGMAITIDGAFSESYGDRGYTLILDHTGTRLAEHSSFDSATEALARGEDIVPTISHIRRYEKPLKVGDSDRGPIIRGEIALLGRLVQAYENSLLPET